MLGHQLLLVSRAHPFSAINLTWRMQQGWCGLHVPPGVAFFQWQLLKHWGQLACSTTSAPPPPFKTGPGWPGGDDDWG